MSRHRQYPVLNARLCMSLNNLSRGKRKAKPEQNRIYFFSFFQWFKTTIFIISPCLQVSNPSMAQTRDFYKTAVKVSAEAVGISQPYWARSASKVTHEVIDRVPFLTGYLTENLHSSGAFLSLIPCGPHPGMLTIWPLASSEQANQRA